MSETRTSAMALRRAPSGSRGRALLPGGGVAREMAITAATAGGQGRPGSGARAARLREWRSEAGGAGGAARAVRVDPGSLPVARRGRGGSGGLRGGAAARALVLARLVPGCGDLSGADLHHRVAEI